MFGSKLMLTVLTVAHAPLDLTRQKNIKVKVILRKEIRGRLIMILRFAGDGMVISMFIEDALRQILRLKGLGYDC